MLVIAATLPGLDEGRAPAEEMGIAIVEASREEIGKLGAR
jgi:hypothetical protein